MLHCNIHASSAKCPSMLQMAIAREPAGHAHTQMLCLSSGYIDLNMALIAYKLPAYGRTRPWRIGLYAHGESVFTGALNDSPIFQSDGVWLRFCKLTQRSAVGTPSQNRNGADWLRSFIEQAETSGLIDTLLDRHKVKEKLSVAAAG